MRKSLLAGIAAALILTMVSSVGFCEAESASQDEILAVASAAVEEKGITVAEDTDIIYDEGGTLWSERVGYLVGEDKSPNHGILRHGFLKNYLIVLYDFKEPLKDVWVFIDKDTGEVFSVYQEQ